MGTNLFKTIRSIIIVMCLTLFFNGSVFAKTVVLPLTLDYQLLESLVIHSAFTEPDHSIVLMNEENDCISIRISEPKFQQENSYVRFETKIHLNAGTSYGDNCLMPVEWKGYLALIQEPKIDGKNWNLSFVTKDSILYNQEHKPAKIAGILWKLIETKVYNHLNNITISLAPPVSKLKSCLLPFFTESASSHAKRMMDSMHPGEIISAEDAIKIDILAAVEDDYIVKEVTDSKPISENGTKKIIETWETLDAFLVYIIGSLENEPLSENDQQILLDALLALHSVPWFKLVIDRKPWIFDKLF